MALKHGVALFQPRLVRDGIKAFAFPDDLAERHSVLKLWIGRLGDGTLDLTKETSLHGEFLQRIFGDVLGYASLTQTPDRWELIAEKTVSSTGKSVDGALGFFDASAKQVIAPIELKAANQSLDHAQSRTLTPVQQAWDYANHSPGARWVLVSNYRETRLYSTARTPDACEVFLLEDLADLNGFRRFYFLLARSQLLAASQPARAPLDDLLVASAKVEAEVTNELYRDYHGLRERLYAHLGKVHSNIPSTELLGFTQTILDRVLFIAFAEKRGLLPPSTLGDALTYRGRYAPKPVWENLVAVFRWIDVGNALQRVPPYNGGLFRANAEIDALQVSDEMCLALGKLALWDFRDEVSVEVLGHIFEQSITDLERMRQPPGPPSDDGPKVSKRKAEGVFYTPAFITRFIVDRTLGVVLREKEQAVLERVKPDAEKKKAKKDAAWKKVWETYTEELKATRVLDLSCGSGAFLLAAFDVLAREYDRVNTALAGIRSGQAGLFDLNATILNNNLFGVDLNSESVEITKLSLWLKTATSGKKLTYLDRNIKHGNSIVGDSRVHPWAFDWKRGSVAAPMLDPPTSAEDRAIDARWCEGFDVVLGNPPYVRQELLSPYKDYLAGVYQSFHAAADLFIYFYERGLSLLKPSGRLGYITSNSWLRANYATPLRHALQAGATIEQIIDLGDNRVFADAPDVYPAIVVLRPGKAPSDHRTQATTFRRGEGIEEFAAQLDSRLVPVSLGGQPDSGWQLGGDAVQGLLDKLLAGGTPLTEVVNGRLFRGILSGLSEAFIVDRATRDAIVRADPSCTSMLKKFVRGEDLRPWYQEDEDRWLIVIPCGWTKATFGNDVEEAPAWTALQKRHPALAKHLAPFEKPARKREDQGDFWWELRPCAYYDALDGPKILWPDLANRPRFSWESAGRYLNNTGYFIPTDDPALLAVLQSRAIWFVISKICAGFGERAGLVRYRLFTQSVERLPIPEMTASQRTALRTSSLDLLRVSLERQGVMDRTTRRIATDLVPAGSKVTQKLAAWWTLDFTEFQSELKKATKVTIPLADRDDWQRLLTERRAEHADLTAQIVAAEGAVNARVATLFGLTRADLKLLSAETNYEYGDV
jgi:type I restriction-modification system DNA methylase subunit